jgi:23S rRNA (adenine2030-N6)-methyltransferase
VNYRHAYHAGNFADCMKHAVLVWILRRFGLKEKPFAVLDTHAGTGFYDLAGDEATRTGEWQGGVGRLLEDTPPALADYVGVVRSLGLYPGSPAIARALMRPGDRLMCCELHPEDFRLLRRRFGGDEAVSVHGRDGYAALAALLPPAERRGLVLIDPPYEAADEFDRVAAGLVTAHRRFAGGVLMAWYPIKGRAPVRAFHAALQGCGIKDVVAAEIFLREPLDAARLNGCGLVVVNPPFRFEDELGVVLEALVGQLGTGEPGHGHALVRIAQET